MPAWAVAVAVAVHTITDRFSWNHKDLSCIVYSVNLQSMDTLNSAKLIVLREN